MQVKKSNLLVGVKSVSGKKDSKMTAGRRRHGKAGEKDAAGFRIAAGKAEIFPHTE